MRSLMPAGPPHVSSRVLHFKNLLLMSGCAGFEAFSAHLIAFRCTSLPLRHDELGQDSWDA